MDDGKRSSGDDPVRASEPAAGAGDSPLASAAASDRENAIDEGSAGDGVAFFEGGAGAEAERRDIEREG